MFPLGILAALGMLSGTYLLGKKMDSDSKNNNQSPTNTASTEGSVSDKAKNIYNYYSGESENGNTLFNSQQKTKRTLFGSNQTV